ncbi:MAG: hypothetical protein A4E42_00233 [Methanoregulaceae archaeon PtaU1.Bin222]|nr:MAG: hypothetical protein A4E42_00233 [Methanoregulaceae archaeon PtaU1.Bin222]
MAQYQRRNPEIIEAFPDKDGNMHLIRDGVLADGVYPKADFDKEWAPVPLSRAG